MIIYETLKDIIKFKQKILTYYYICKQKKDKKT